MYDFLKQCPANPSLFCGWWKFTFSWINYWRWSTHSFIEYWIRWARVNVKTVLMTNFCWICFCQWKDVGGSLVESILNTMTISEGKVWELLDKFQPRKRFWNFGQAKEIKAKSSGHYLWGDDHVHQEQYQEIGG